MVQLVTRCPLYRNYLAIERQANVSMAPVTNVASWARLLLWRLVFPKEVVSILVAFIVLTRPTNITHFFPSQNFVWNYTKILVSFKEENK